MNDGRTPPLKEAKIDARGSLLAKGAELTGQIRRRHLVAAAGQRSGGRLDLADNKRRSIADDDGRKPLFIACQNGHVDAARLLLDKK